MSLTRAYTNKITKSTRKYEMSVLNCLASFWRRICSCSSCGLCDKRMVGKYVFSCYKLWIFYSRISAMKLQSVSISDDICVFMVICDDTLLLHENIFSQCGRILELCFTSIMQLFEQAVLISW